MENQNNQPHVYSVRFYLRVFGMILALFFFNILIYKLNVPSPYSFIILLSVATVQAVLVLSFFMELAHEDKFYSFAFGSCILFIALFLSVSLAEITGRNFFHPDEGAHVLRNYDNQGYAPAGPEQTGASTSSETTKE